MNIHRNGLTVADLVFPLFIWIMGTSMALSFDKIASQSINKASFTRDLLIKIIKRSVILFSLGFFFYTRNYDYAHARISGVLERFGVTFLVVALIASFVPKYKYD